MRILIALLLAAQAVTPVPQPHTFIWVDPIQPEEFKHEEPAHDIRFCVPAFHKSDMEPIPCPPVERVVCGAFSGPMNPQDAQRCNRVKL